MSSMELPETLIHRIQSLLTLKEAARTALLSKAWRAALSTRPTIEIDESNFTQQHYIHRDIEELVEFTQKTFRRYKESNLTIDTFIMSLNNQFYVRFGLAEQWTSKALKLGATDLTLQLTTQNTCIYSIPLTEVSRMEKVVRLSLTCFQIDRLKVINCTGLKSLTLSHFYIVPDQFFDILSRFPLIEYLSLSYVSRGYDVRFSPPTIIFDKLRSLVLSQFQMMKLFPDNLSAMFPNLKDLTLGLDYPNIQYSYGLADERIRNISSYTLETLNLKYPGPNAVGLRIPGVTFDVPSIRKFTFESLWIPKLRFSPTHVGNQWESHVVITNFGDMSTTWFRQLNQLLKKLKGSKIHLSLHFCFNISFDYEVGEMDGLNVYEVENLTLDMTYLPSFSCYAVLDGLFRTCHPKMITQYVTPGVNDYGGIDNTRKNYLLICRSLEQGMQVKSVLLPNQLMYGLRDLEELDAQQLFDGEWKTQPLGSILDDVDSTSQELKRRFRLQLKWKPSSSIDQYTRHSDDDDADEDEYIDQWFDDESIDQGYWSPDDIYADNDHMYDEGLLL